MADNSQFEAKVPLELVQLMPFLHTIICDPHS